LEIFNAKHIGNIMNKLIRMKDVKTITALSPATIYRQMAMGKFPKAVKLTEKTSAWVEAEVIDFVEKRIALRAT
jgi:prophage regulatory protein